eukprot:7292901-Prymnesium_polylepis.1
MGVGTDLTASLRGLDFRDGTSVAQQVIRAAISGLSTEKMPLLVNYMRGINPSLINDQAFGFGYFDVPKMSGSDIKKLVDFATKMK